MCRKNTDCLLCTTIPDASASCVGYMEMPLVTMAEVTKQVAMIDAFFSINTYIRMKLVLSARLITMSASF